eukprot:761890_1
METLFTKKQSSGGRSRKKPRNTKGRGGASKRNSLSKRKTYDWDDTEDYVPGLSDSGGSASSRFTFADSTYDSRDNYTDNDLSSEYYRPKHKKIRGQKRKSSPIKETHNRKKRRKNTQNTNQNVSIDNPYTYPELPSPPLPTSNDPLPSHVYNVLPMMPLDNHRSYVPTPEGTPETSGVRLPAWQDTSEQKQSIVNTMESVPSSLESIGSVLNETKIHHRSKEEKRATKHRHHGYQCNTNGREPTIGIPKRLRNHINPKAFAYYTGMPRCWYNANEVVTGINTGRIIKANMQRLNHAHHLANALLTDTIITNNMIEYPLAFMKESKENEDEDILADWIDCDVEQDEEYWKALIAHLEADNEVLQHVHEKMMGEMVSRHRNEVSESLPNRHQPLLCEQFNDLMFHHKEYAQYKYNLHEKSYIESRLNKETLDRCLMEMERLKKGPNPGHRAKERKNALRSYYRRKEKKRKDEFEAESELQTESENDDVEEDKKRNDLDVDYNVKYDYYQDMNERFDIKKVAEGLPNGPLFMKIVQQMKVENELEEDYWCGKRTLMDIPVNDSVSPHIMADLVKQYANECGDTGDKYVMDVE